MAFLTHKHTSQRLLEAELSSQSTKGTAYIRIPETHKSEGKKWFPISTVFPSVARNLVNPWTVSQRQPTWQTSIHSFFKKNFFLFAHLCINSWERVKREGIIHLLVHSPSAHHSWWAGGSQQPGHPWSLGTESLLL